METHQETGQKVVVKLNQGPSQTYKAAIGCLSRSGGAGRGMESRFFVKDIC